MKSDAVLLGDVTAVIDCEHRTAPRAAADEQFGYSIGTMNVRDGRLLLDNAKPVSKQTFLDWTRRAVPQVGDLIFSREAPMGEVGEVPSGLHVCLGQRTVLLRPRPDRVTSKYLRYLLMSPRCQDWIRSNATGSTVLHVNVADVRRLPLGELPDLPLQMRIVEMLEDHLSRLDAAGRLLDVATARTDRWELSALWRLTHVAGVRTVRLDDVAEVKLGRQRSPSNHSGPRMRPYLRAANVHWNQLRLGDINEMNFSDAEEAVFRLEPDDILVVEASGSAGEVGKSAIYRGEIASACFQNTLLRVRCTKAVPAFVQKYLLAEALAGRLVKESRGVGIHHIGQARLAALPVAVPSEEDQVRIGEAASDLMHAAAGCRESIRTARRRADGLRKGLLNAAFSGRQADGLRPSGVEEVLHV